MCGSQGMSFTCVFINTTITELNLSVGTDMVAPKILKCASF